MHVPTPECPVCRVTMEAGHVLQTNNNAQLVRTKWTEGEPEKSAMGGHKVKGKRQFETVTFRCPRCGWLVWFAPETAE